ncbi:MAG: VCBS repeat-containing protein [Bacteroidetes bacterium]|nr:VCBS repeat-containing protein [Bacteroidota bacterium]MBS1945300.1 VCBS repeat-containing protein [Bacteroidota bacterium]
MNRLLLLPLIGAAAMHAHAQGTCATAIPVSIATYYADQIDGPEAPSPICSGGTPATMGRWYKFTATADTSITITTDLPQNGGTDTRVQVYTGTCGNLACYAGDDDSGSGYTSVTSFQVHAGTAYYIAFDNRWTANGFTFQVKYSGPGPVVDGYSTQYVPTNGVAYCVVDMNNDGLDDAVSVTSNTITINYQNPGGGFTTTTLNTPTATNTPSWSICAGDLDHNGYNDLVYAGSGVSFMLANSTGTGYFAINQPEYIFCQRSNMVDINNDGKLDLFVCHDVQPNVYYLNNNNTSWAWHQGGLGDTPDGGNYGSIWIDYNNDGHIDLFIAKCRGAGSPASIDQLWRNNGDGTFTDMAPQMADMADYQQSWSSAWADFDNDGDLDVMVGASSFTGGGHKLYRNDGNTFTNITPGSGFDLYNGTNIEFIARDFDNDGYVDVLGGGMLMKNNGNMTFSPVPVPFSNGPTGDLNNDGFIDVQNGNTLYLNGGNGNHWLKVITKGVQSNANGIGARVQVTTPSGIQVRDIVSGDGFRYMSSLTAHFGLGSNTQVNQVVVRWPSGIVDTIANPPVNTTLTVVEGQSGITTGIAATEVEPLSLFPSPAHNTLNVIARKDLADSKITVTDPAGKVVAMPGLVRGTIDVAHLASGLYLLRIEGPSGVLSGKFVKE